MHIFITLTLTPEENFKVNIFLLFLNLGVFVSKTFQHFFLSLFLLWWLFPRSCREELCKSQQFQCAEVQCRPTFEQIGNSPQFLHFVWFAVKSVSNQQAVHSFHPKLWISPGWLDRKGGPRCWNSALIWDRVQCQGWIRSRAEVKMMLRTHKLHSEDQLLPSGHGPKVAEISGEPKIYQGFGHIQM